MSDNIDLDTPYIADIELDRSSGTPLYQQISTPLTSLIMSGAIEPGRLIEDEISLAHRLNVSRPTARRALQELVASGLVMRRRGAGTRVTPNHVHRQIALTSLKDDLVKAGYSTKTKVLSYSIQFADEAMAKDLHCEVGTELVTVKRLRSIGETPLAIMTNTIPLAYAPSLTNLATAGLYECFKQQGITLASAVQTIGARNATEAEAELLHLEPGAALLTMVRTAYSDQGEIIESGSHAYDAAQYHVTIPLVADN